MHFTWPSEITGKEVLLAELTFDIALPSDINSPFMELRFCPLLVSPPEGNFDYNSLEVITDSMSLGAWISSTAGRASFRVHITDYVRGLAAGERANFSLIGIPDIMRQENVRFPENLSIPIQERARVRVIYK